MKPLPANGSGYDGLPHLQRSAIPDHVALQMQQQVFYLEQIAPQNDSRTDVVVEHAGRAGSDADLIPVRPNDNDDQHLRQSFHSFAPGNVADSGLMRYHSAPSSMLASIIGTGDGLSNQDAQLCQYTSRDAMLSEAKGLFQPIDRTRPFNNGQEGRVCGVVGTVTSRDPDHNGKLMSPHSRFRPSAGSGSLNNKEHMLQAGQNVKMECLDNSKPLMHLASTDMVMENGRAPGGLVPSFSVRDPHIPMNSPSKNTNELVHGAPVISHGLMRHSSSPAGFLAQLNDENISSGNSSEDGSFERQSGAPLYGNYGWDEALHDPVTAASFGSRKRIKDQEERFQQGDSLGQCVVGNHIGMCLSTSPENVYFPDKLSADFVACRTRAKRGCATHPRSIAERVRRNKINERLKKLQDLVPNVDKQANTAEMLDEVVDYVKFLQSQVQELTESKSKCECACSNREKETSMQK